MKIPLSARLRACCDFITPGDRVADIGTDHGYLGIWLLHQGIARSVIASDIAPGPLSAARRNAEKYGFTQQMEFCLSDGVTAVPQDFDTLVCAGMGGDTMISILQAAPWLQNPQYRLVLQCQSKTPMLRRWLCENGYSICRETVLRDGRFLYSVMEVIHSPGQVLTPGGWYFPPALLKDPSPTLPEYYRRVTGGLEYAITNRGDRADPMEVIALKELLEDPNLQWLKEDAK